MTDRLAFGPMRPRARQRTGVGVVQSDGLTKQERKVAVLIRRGFTNAEIAQRLVIETGTAKNHVHNVLEKLGLRSRTEVGVWVSERKRGRERDGPKMYPMAHDGHVSGR